MSATLREISKPLRLASRPWRSRIHHQLGELRRRWDGHPVGPESVLLILGCQRSGTTMMTEVFSRDAEAKVFGEYSVLSAQDRTDHLRLAALEEVARRLAQSRYPLIVMKPLVESQCASDLLYRLPRSRALWLVRHPADVARSNLSRFGRDNGIRNLERLLSARPGDWRGERVGRSVRSEIAAHFSPSMDQMDAAALFWWARNTHFFSQGLDAREDVLPIRYESLVTDPGEAMKAIYAFAKRPYPGDRLVEHVSDRSIGRASADGLSASVRALCMPLLERFDDLIDRRRRCA